MINCIKDFFYRKNFTFLFFSFIFIGSTQNVWGQYCTPTTTNDGTNGDYLKNFKISGGLAGFTDTDPSTNGYLNYYDTYYGEQTAGSYLNFNTGTRGNNVRLSIWVDWNKNEEFEETEKIFNQYIPNQDPNFSGIINIPPATANGDYRMRVRSAGGTEYLANQIDPCGNILWGQARDYKIIVLLTCKAPLMATASNVFYTSARLNWVKQYGSLPSSYRVEWSTNSGFPSGSTNSAVVSDEYHNITGMNPDVTYYYRVRSECGGSNGNSGWSAVESFKTGTYTPLEISGFNEDVIAEVGTDPDQSTTVAMDNSAYVLPENGFVDENGETSSYGMPKNRVMHNGTTGNISPADVKYLFRTYTNSNVLQLSSSYNTKSFLLDQPVPVSKLYFAGISTEGSSTLNIKLIYEDDTEQIFSGINLEDWYGSNNHVFESDYRVSQDWTFDTNKMWPKMRQVSITSGIDTNRKVKEIEITKTASGSYAHLFAVNVQPEWARIVSLTANPACEGEQVTILVTGDNATKYRWYTQQTGGTPVAETTDDWTFTLGADTTFWAEAVNDAFGSYVYTNPQRVRVDIPTSDVQFTANTGNWNLATNWTPSVVPDITKCVRVPNGKTLTVNVNDAEAKNVTVDAGGKLTIQTNQTLLIDDFFKHLGSGNEADVVIKHNANLIQNNNVANEGLVTVEKNFKFSTERKQYNYVTAPMVTSTDRKIKGTIYTPNPESVQEYNTGNDYFYETEGPYVEGLAYAVKESPSGPATVDGKLMGVPFNGDLNYTLKTNGNKYNLIGNPYPSNLDIKKLYDANDSTIESDFYFWDNTNNTLHVQQGSGYNGDHYAKFDAAAGTNGTGTPAPCSSYGSGCTKVPDRFVKVGTGFMVQAINAGPLQFRNSYRTSSGTVEFFGKPFGPENQDARYWMTLTAPSGIITNLAVVYFEGGDDHFGRDDFESLLASDDIYTMAEGHKLNIQGKAPFRNTDEIPLGYKAFEAGTHIIAVHEKEGLFAEQQSIWLIDRLLRKTVNLSVKPYKFVTRSGEYNDRFLIVYRPGAHSTGGVDISNSVDISKIDNQIVITSSIDKIAKVELFDLNSRPVYKKADINSNEHRINAARFNHQIVVVTVQTDKGEFVTKKFVNN